MKQNANDGIDSATVATFGTLETNLALPFLLATFTAIAVGPCLAAAPAKSETIPVDQIGAVAGKQYQGDWLLGKVFPDRGSQSRVEKRNQQMAITSL